MRSRAVRITLLTLLALAATISLVQGLRNALHSSADLQWTDVVLLKHGEDPYRVYLSGDPKHQLMPWQIPNYLHEMYVIELPLAWASWPAAERIWAVVNLALLTASLVLLIRIYRLSSVQAFTYVALVLCSTGFRNTLGLGQQSFFALLCFLLSLGAASPFGRSIALGGLYAKYSFAPAVVGYRLARREFGTVACSLVLPALGYAVVLLCVSEKHPWRLAVEPFVVSRTGVGPGKADIMTLIEQLSSGRAATLLAYGLGLGLALLYGWYAHRSNLSLPASVAGLAAATLLCVKHVEYDLLFLIAPLAFFLKQKWSPRSLTALAICGYLFYVDRWLPLQKMHDSQTIRILYFALIATVIVLIHITDRSRNEQPAVSPPGNQSLPSFTHS